MLARFIGILAYVLATIPAWPQVEPGATGGGATAEGDAQMMTPPPVSGSAYSTTPGSETRSNYLSIGVTAGGDYLSNIPSDKTGASSSVGAFSISPDFMLSRSTPRQQVTLSYSPSILFYEPAISPDVVDQGAAAAIQDRLTQTLSVSIEDSFYKTSDVFDSSYVFSSGITGSTQTTQATVIAPFTQQLTNIAGANLSYQFGRNGMIGGGVDSILFELPIHKRDWYLQFQWDWGKRLLQSAIVGQAVLRVELRI